MTKLRPAMFVALTAATLAAPAPAAKLIMGAYPNALIVFDEAKKAVTEKILLETGLPMSLYLSADKKRIYVQTLTNSGIEVIDAATLKVINRFTLNTPTTRYRVTGGVPDPSGRYYYAILTQIDKGVDRYTIHKPKYAVIDLEKREIAKLYDIAAEDEDSNARRWRELLTVSPDGKFLYQFREKIVVLSTDDFKVVERIDLAKPEGTGLENLGFGGSLDSIAEPGRHIALLNAEDPYIHSKTFGIGRFDLSNRRFDFTPIGPAPTAMAGLQVAPNGREAYTVVTNGQYGNKRCEFWSLDMKANGVRQRAEFPCRTRFSFGMSGNGQKLYIYGASFDIESYDAKTLAREAVWDLKHDITGAGLIVVD